MKYLLRNLQIEVVKSDVVSVCYQRFVHQICRFLVFLCEGCSLLFVVPLQPPRVYCSERVPGRAWVPRRYKRLGFWANRIAAHAKPTHHLSSPPLICSPQHSYCATANASGARCVLRYSNPVHYIPLPQVLKKHFHD